MLFWGVIVALGVVTSSNVCRKYNDGRRFNIEGTLFLNLVTSRVVVTLQVIIIILLILLY